MKWSEIKGKVPFINTDTGNYGDIIFLYKLGEEYHYVVIYTNDFGLFYQYVREDTLLPDNYKLLANEGEENGN